MINKLSFEPTNHAFLPIAEPRVDKNPPIFFGADAEKVRYLLPKEPYVILAPDAGDPCKSLPDHILLEAIGSYPVEAKLVLLGSTKIPTASNIWQGKDERLKNVLDLRNALNVPETILAIPVWAAVLFLFHIVVVASNTTLPVSKLNEPNTVSPNFTIIPVRSDEPAPSPITVTFITPLAPILLASTEIEATS